MRRAFWVWLHRWVGLAMTGFLVIVGLTGSVLAFREELDVWLNPDLLSVTPRDAPMLDPLILREKALALFPGAQVDGLQLRVEPGRSFEINVSRPEANDGLPTSLYLDPFSGEKLGERVWGEASMTRRGIASFLYRLHYSLALPTSTGGFGAYILGVVALLWTVDCFVSVYLTLPLPRRETSSGKSWRARWKPAWLIKIDGGVYRINFDIHRAFGLWTWVMLFVFAWSSVAFNLNEVYTPTMRSLFGLSAQINDLPVRAVPLEQPRLEWRAARDAGHALLMEIAHANAFVLHPDETLYFDRVHGVYYQTAKSSLDPGRNAASYVVFDADTGELQQASWPGQPSARAGDVITRWLSMLHMAAVFGLPMQIFVCVMGIVIVTLAITGVVIWLKKREARKSRRLRSTRDACDAAVANGPERLI